MPTYVYRCKKGHTFELFHAISDDSPKRGPKCRSSATRVPAGGSGVLFRGTGFYATDYRSKGYKEAAKRESGAPASGKSEGGSKPGAPGEAGSGKPSKSEGSGGGKKGE